MIDFQNIKISEEKLGSFNEHVQLKGGIAVTHTTNLIKNATEAQKELVRAQIKRELFKKLYGDLYNPVQELKNLVKEYLLEPAQNSAYQYHPYFLNSARTKELIDELDDLLKMPE